MLRIISLLVSTLALSPAFAQLDTSAYNRVQMRGGVEIELPATPSDPAELALFQTLSPEQKETFYQRRQFLIRRLVGTLAFPRALGGVAWAKKKAGLMIRKLKNQEVPVDDTGPMSLKENGRRILETLVSVFVDKLWSDSKYIATANSVGFTLFAGPVVNTSFAKWGFLWARGLSLDIGHDFSTEKGYLRLYFDRHDLKTPGLSFDIGMMFDFLVHFNNVPTEGTDLGITHYKLPLIGCYRHGPEYRAYGLQLGVQALDIAALAIAYHHPQIAAGILLGTRFMGSATIYATDLKRKFLAKKDVSARWWSDLFRRRNPEAAQQICEASLTDASQEPETTSDEE